MSMYKVFLADDEAAMRTGVRNNVAWDESDFVLAGEAPDGELALSQMQEIMPDILITDVRMPFMDGIELSRIVRKTMPWIKIIILSGHDEFEYAKQAISIGVEEYLLKPITSEKLLSTLNEVAVKIEEDKARSQNIESLINDVKKTRIEKLISDILFGNMQESEAASLAEELGLSFDADYYQVMIVELHSSSPEKFASLSGTCAAVTGVLSDWGNSIFLMQGQDRIICILKGNDQESLDEDAYTCAAALKYEVERNNVFTVTVAIGSIVSAVSEWPKSLSDADAAKRYINAASKNQILSVRDISSDSGSRYKDIMEKALDYIRENYAQQDISLHSLAKEVNFSPNHFSTIFRQETGESFISYLTRTRIEQAKILLKTTKIKATDIGYDVGYNDTHYFSYVFKKHTGMSPKEFRSI